MPNCPICNSHLLRFNDKLPDRITAKFYSCPLCGEFTLGNSLIEMLPQKLQENKDSSAKISHFIRSMFENGNKVELNNMASIDKILEIPLPTPIEQADLFVRWLAKNSEYPGKQTQIKPEKYKAIIGAKSDEGCGLVLEYLFEKGLLKGDLSKSVGSYGSGYVTLSVKGWEYYENLKRGIVTHRKAFMAMEYGDKQIDKIVNDVFKPCVKETGFELCRLDDRPKAGLIDDRLRVEIQTSDFLIADLTLDNPGAYWEAGYAEGLGKPVIYTCEKEKFDNKKTHFDTNHHLTIIWDKENMHECSGLLKATIQATLPHLAKMIDK